MPATRLRRWLHRTEIVVGIASGFVGGLIGIAYLPPLAPDPPPPTLAAVTNVLPLWVFGLMWLTVLPMSVAAIWARKMRAPTALVFAGLSAFSGLVSVISWLAFDAQRGWLGALLYGFLAVMVGGYGFITSIAERQQVLIESLIRGRSCSGG